MATYDNGMLPEPQQRVPESSDALVMTPSVHKLAWLNFDPIEELIKQYKRLTEEDEWHRDVRLGKITWLNADGEPKNMRYSSVAHAATLALLQKTANDLMRYKYARVPETANLNVAQKPKGMTVRLHKTIEAMSDKAEYVDVTEADYDVVSPPTSR